MERISQNELPEGLFDVVMAVQNYVNRSGIDKKLEELMKMRVSLINGCAYCIDMHYKLALHYGESALRITSVSVWREVSYYSEKEKAVFEYAEVLTRMPENTGIEKLHEKLSAFFSKSEIAQLALSIAQINTWNRLMIAFGRTAGNFQVASYRVAS